MLLGPEWPGTLTSPVASNSLSWYPQLLSPGLSLIARGAIISLLSGVSRFDFPRWVKDPSFFLPEVSRGRPPSHPALSPSIPGCAPSRSASTSSRGAPRVLAQASGGSMSRRWCWLRLSPGCGWTDGWAVAAGLGGGGPAPRSAPPRPALSAPLVPPKPGRLARTYHFPQRTSQHLAWSGAPSAPRPRLSLSLTSR